MKRYNVYKEGRLYKTVDTINEAMDIAISIYASDTDCISVMIWDNVEDCEVR